MATGHHPPGRPILRTGFAVERDVVEWRAACSRRDCWPSSSEGLRFGTGGRTTVPVNIADLKREFARLNADAELHQRTVERILARQRSVARSTGAEVVDADDALKAQLERSALTLVNRGDNLLHDPRAKAEAVESFRRVLELFPQSRGAALARERLNQIGA